MRANNMVKSPANPRILIITPEITYLPTGMGNMANRLGAKAGGLADVSASLVSALFELGADVHVALPHYRQMFNVDARPTDDIYRSDGGTGSCGRRSAGPAHRFRGSDSRV